MARDYGKRRSNRQSGSAPHQFLVLLVTFLLGYLTATAFDLESLTRWLNTQVLASHEEKPPAVKPEPQRAQTPAKPKFEFYTLLANEKNARPHAASNPAANTNAATVVANAATSKAAETKTVKPAEPAAITVAEGKPLNPATTGRGTYLVQVAAFKARADAEQMKGTLILKGFDVTVMPVTNSKGNWFRVVVGPYSNRALAQQAQSALARTQRLNGVLISAG